MSRRRFCLQCCSCDGKLKQKRLWNLHRTVSHENIVEHECLTTFFDRQLVPVYKRFSGLLKINYHPYGNFKKTSCHQVDGNWECTCQQGPVECQKNYLQACMLDRIKDPYPIDLLRCMQKQKTFLGASYVCLEEKFKIDRQIRESILECAKSQEGVKLMVATGVRSLRNEIFQYYYVPHIAIMIASRQLNIFELVLCQSFSTATSQWVGSNCYLIVYFA
ncbi:gamma interferon inducible lysosomal thiol reductase [Cooperia oncophora]